MGRDWRIDGKETSMCWPAVFDLFSLTGTSRKYSEGPAATAGDNFAVIDLHRSAYAWSLRWWAAWHAVRHQYFRRARRTRTTRRSSTSTSIATTTVTPDYAVFNRENGGLGATGQNVVSVVNLVTVSPSRGSSWMRTSTRPT